ncbi:MAG: hypothetical protein KGH91_05550 [Rhodospirillales bacterium]|nr:hypothetical protein [Rhodospirillales bacterium]
MSYELISEEEYANLPDEDDRCFVEFEHIVRRNMTRMIDENTSREFDLAVREQYMAAVAAVAWECHISNIEYNPDSNNNFNEAFSRFSLAVQGEVAKIRIRLRGIRHPYSVLLTGSTRTKIEHYIARIRDTVERSDLDHDRKKRLWQRLDQLMAELKSPRLNFAKTMGILAAVVATTGSLVTIAAEGQSAVAHIMQLIGHDKETEEAATERLAPPPKALPSPPATAKPAPQQPERPTVAELDDEIPF